MIVLPEISLRRSIVKTNWPPWTSHLALFAKLAAPVCSMNDGDFGSGFGARAIAALRYCLELMN